jgi:thiosulfate/3-mercaptopyruvate sulfurtransferase
MTEPIVSSEWLNQKIRNPDIIILDTSSRNNQAGIDSKYKNQIIPYSRLFNLKDDFSDKESPFPNTFPSVTQFENESRKLGISNSSTIVIYDNLGIYHSARVWWMFKTMGHKSVYVLNGGLPNWIQNDFETVESYQTPNKSGTFIANLNSTQIKNIDFIRSNILTQNHSVVDARSKDRFQGVIPEPRKGLRSGHIPNSINIPYTDVLENEMYKSEKNLKEIFEDAGVGDRPITFSCGSGVTACIVLLAAEMVLKNDTSVYDGAWTEYGSLINEGI